MLRKEKYDVILLQQEALPWIPGWFEKILLKSKIKLISDHDDAFFHRYDLHKFSIIRKLLGKKIDSVMSQADIVFAGNEYIGERAKRNNEKVEIFPTVVNTDIYKKTISEKDGVFTIGWIGSPGTSKYLKNIENDLCEIYKTGNVRINFVGAGDIKMDGFDYNIIAWEESTEVLEISKFDVGIMPLPDSPWERGKCGFKLIQCMACEVPVIASPVGVNRNIIQNGENGFLAESSEDWIKYFYTLKNDEKLRCDMGYKGRKLIEEKFSLDKNAALLIDIINNLVNNRN